MNKVIIMVGISGSGKSYKTDYLKNKYNAIVLSSDELRKTLYGDETDQTHNEEVFGTLYKNLRDLLTQGKNVIVDATNITIKSRRKIIEEIKRTKINTEIIAYVMTKPIEICIKNDRIRKRHVGKEVIYAQREKFQIPFYEEGIDKIILENYSKREETTQEKLNTLIAGMEGFDQQNSHHKYDLLTHCSKTFQLLEDVNADPCVQMAASLHDIGKMETKKLKDNGEYGYYGHANVGAYQLLDELKLGSTIPNAFQKTLEILFYVNYHMLPMNWNEEKTHDKYKQLFGKTKYDNLMLLHHCDKIASGITLNTK